MMKVGGTETWQDILAELAEYLYSDENFCDKDMILIQPPRTGKTVAMKAVQEMLEEYEALVAAFDGQEEGIMEKYDHETEEEAFDREWNRQRQREALPRDRGRARARYKAHCIRMTAQKARQHLRRRKYRSGANAGVW